MQEQVNLWLKSYDDHVQPEIDYPDISVGDLYKKGILAFPEKTAFWFMKKEVNYAELWGMVQRFATYLQKNGLQKGDTVAICLPNCPEYVIAHIATIIAGGVSSGLSPLLSTREIAYQLEDSEAKFLVTLDATFEKHIAKIAAKVPKLQTIIYCNITDNMGLPKPLVFIAKLIKKVPKGKVKPLPNKTVIHFKDVLKTEKNLKEPVIQPKEDLVRLYYTGGTTGSPKGVELTHENIVAMLTILNHWVQYKFGEETFLTAFPFFHAAGILVFDQAVSFAASQVLIANPRDTKHLIKEWIEKRPTLVGNVPSLYLMILQDPLANSIPREILDHVHLYVSGAAPFPADLIRRFEREMHAENKVVEVYGMTECSPLIAANPVKNEKRIGTVGLPLPNTQIKIVDLDSGEQVPLGTAGEVLVKGPQVMRGYKDKPEENAQVFDNEGWLHTGDIGKMDEDGYITLVDRVKDMLIVSGYKVYSIHVEDILVKHPDIDMVAIIGEPDPDRPGSEQVKAIVKLREGVMLTPELKASIEEFAEENLSRYEKPKIWDFRDEIPLTTVGKISKLALRMEKNANLKRGV